MESEQNIKEWFCEEKLIDFWSFFAAIVENYSGLLKVMSLMGVSIIRRFHCTLFIAVSSGSTQPSRVNIFIGNEI